MEKYNKDLNSLKLAGGQGNLDLVGDENDLDINSLVENLNATDWTVGVIPPVQGEPEIER